MLSDGNIHSPKMKIKQHLLILLFLIPVFSAFSQQSQSGYPKDLHQQKDIDLLVSPLYIYSSPFGSCFGGGLEMQYFLGKRFSLNAGFVIGQNYGHLGFSTVLLPVMLAAAGKEGLAIHDDDSLGAVLLKSVIIFLSIEQSAFHIPLYAKADLAPYMNLFRLILGPTYSTLPGNWSYGEMTTGSALGIRFIHHSGRLLLGPYAEICLEHKNLKIGTNAGISIGFAFSGTK